MDGGNTVRRAADHQARHNTNLHWTIPRIAIDPAFRSAWVAAQLSLAIAVCDSGMDKRLERAAIHRATTTHLGRLIGCQAVSKFVVSLVSPDGVDTVTRHVAEVNTIRRCNDTARDESGVKFTGTRPEPISTARSIVRLTYYWPPTQIFNYRSKRCGIPDHR
jgi:hypothetical protein